MDDFWPVLWAALVSALVSGGFVLGGVWITNRHERNRQREVLREEALAAQRDLVVAIVVAGHEWKALQLVMVPMMSRLSGNDLIEFASSDTGARLGKLHEDLSLALTRGRLFLVHQEVLTAVAEVSAFIEGFPEEVNGPVMQNPNDLGSVTEGLRKVYAFGRMLKHLETVATKELRSALWDA